MPVLPEIVTRDYTDRKELAKTQFALLFRGTHRTDGKEHLLKIPLTPEAGENLKKACEFLKGHPHPSFPAVFGWHDATQNQYGVFIREFVGGESLAGYGGRLAEDQIRSIAVQIARGLAHIHFRGLIFGDVSTNNFIFDRGKVAFIDFEFLGRRHEGGTPIRGTPSFMAPELFYGNPPTIQSDLYALGVVLYFLMTGEVPVKGDDYPQLIQAHLFGEIPNPAVRRTGGAPQGGADRGLSEEFGLLVLRLLNREPAERFLEANEFIRELNRICKTPFETEPEPETLAGQEKIRVLKGYSLLNDTLQQLEKKKNRTPAELATLLKIYMKRADADKIRPLLGELSGNDRLYFEVQLSNLEGRYQETAELLKGRKNSIDERFIPPWATALYHLGEREAGEKLLEKSIVQARERKDEEKLANYQIYLGNFLLFNRQIGPAVSHYEKAVNVAGNGGFVHLEAMALMNLANAELARHQWGEAIEAYQKARRINELAGNRLEAIRTALNLSGILRFMGHLEKSRELLDQSRAYLSEFGNPQLNLYTCLLSADLEKKKKNFNEAKKHLDSAQEILKGHYTEAETGDLLVSRVEIALEEGKASEAKTGLDALEKFAGAQKDPLLEGRLKTLRMAALLFGKEEEFKPSRLISPLKEMVSQGDIEFSLDNLSRAIRLCEKRKWQTEYEALMEYQDELLRFCDKKLPPDYRERFFFFYRHHPRETAIQPTATFLLKRILDTTRDLMAELDLNILVRKILHLMMEVTRTDRGFVILLADKEPVISYTHKMDTRSIKNEEESDAISWTLTKQALADRKPLMTIDALGDERFAETRSVQRLQLQSIVILPFLFRGEVMGAVYLDSRLKSEQLKKDDLPYLEALADQIGIALHNAREFGKAEAQLNQAKKTLDRQERELHFRYSYKNFLGRSEKILAVFELLDRVIDTPVPILLRGESGTGKEMIAKIIHYNSRRQGRQMVSINCGAIPATLLESELFGHVKGSFTGAFENKTGLFEQADGGTLFLDEIGDMPFDMQVKLLRALQDMTIRPVGATHDKKVDVRVICATHRPIEEMIREKKFREDLFYRINTAEIVIPPLRERREDIPLLISHFLEEWAKQPGGRKKQIDADALACLTEQTWPGNVRQLENTLYNLCVFSEAERITLKEVEARKDLFDGSGSPAVLPPSQFPADTTPDDLAKAIDERKITLPEAKQAFEKKQILRVLKLHEGRVGKAAEHLQMPRPQVSRLIKRYQIEK